MQDVLFSTVISCIQDTVDKIQEEAFNSEIEDGDLQFIVSCLYEELEGQNLSTNKIILTIKHHKWTNSRILFPSKISHYGFDSLSNIMREMYNQTM